MIQFLLNHLNVKKLNYSISHRGFRLNYLTLCATSTLLKYVEPTQIVFLDFLSTKVELMTSILKKFYGTVEVKVLKTLGRSCGNV